jgi:pimeloyl-ACP methyl ester carboxylesterase
MATSEITIPIRRASLGGLLTVPARPLGIVLLEHGSGSGRFSDRNRRVARVLEEGGFATLLVDLLTAEEGAFSERVSELPFDVSLLAERLIEATDWIGSSAATRSLPIGYFGADTGAAVALIAAAERPYVVRAVVSRGGRPDLARGALRRVRASTLLIVGGDDVEIVRINRAALDSLACEKRLVIVPGASHVFGEPGAIDEVARRTRSWFERRLVATPYRDARPSLP